MIRTACALFALACLVAAAPAQQWGTVKGQVVWGGAAIPKRAEVKVTKDQDHCGKLLDDELLIDPKTNGVKDVLVWLKPIGDAAMPIHPDSKKVPEKIVEIDQPRCQFTP